jgi:hypothetical protein
MCFQQDGANSHTARVSFKVVVETFPGHLIALSRKLPWPARSPDLSVCDYCFFEYVRAKLYTNRPRTFDDFKMPVRK